MDVIAIGNRAIHGEEIRDIGPQRLAEFPFRVQPRQEAVDRSDVLVASGWREALLAHCKDPGIAIRLGWNLPARKGPWQALEALTLRADRAGTPVPQVEAVL